MRLIARVALRHEDELSNQNQKRVFVLTFETKKGSALDRLYELAVIWHTMQSPLRLMLFLGLLEHLKLRLRALEASEELRDLIVQQGLHLGGGSSGAPIRDQQKKLEPSGGDPHAPVAAGAGDTVQTGEHHHGALVQFHATRKPFENVEGDTITFLMRIGLRDPRARPGA